jgi:putative transposase
MRSKRKHATSNGQTYFVTSATWGRRRLFHVTRWADRFIDTLNSYRGRAYLLHEYVLMPEHFHVLITPIESLERAMQFIKGGFQRERRKSCNPRWRFGRVGFSDHRIRGAEDYERHIEYIYRNPVGRGLAEHASHCPYCSAFAVRTKDKVPQWLKPLASAAVVSRLEAAHFQSKEMSHIKQLSTRRLRSWK